MDLSKYTIKELKKIISVNLYVEFKGYTRFKRRELEKIIELFEHHIKKLPEEKTKKVKKIQILKENDKPKNFIEQLQNLHDNLMKIVKIYNKYATEYINYRNDKAKEIYIHRKQTGEQITKAKYKTILNNLDKKDDYLIDLWDNKINPLLADIDNLEEIIRKIGIDNGLDYKEREKYETNIKIIKIK